MSKVPHDSRTPHGELFRALKEAEADNARLREENARLKEDIANFERTDRSQRAAIMRLKDELAQKTLVLDGRATTELAGLRHKKREGR